MPESPKLPDKPSDPNLLAAMEEIKTILAKHDIAGCCVLASATHSEYLNSPEASWNCIKLEKPDDNGPGYYVRIKAKRDDFATREHQIRVVTNTAGFIAGTIDTLGHCLDNFKQLFGLLSQNFDIKHVSRHYPHN